MYIWENPSIIAVNKEKGYTIMLPYSEKYDALARKNSSFKISLNGKWKFMWHKGEAIVSPKVLEKDYDDSQWEDIIVPGVWQTQKSYTKPLYFANSYPSVICIDEKKIPKIDVKGQEIGVHRTVFCVPDTWNGREIFLHFGAVKAGLQLYVNGQFVGYSQGSNTPHEFDITDFAVIGENQVTAIVYRYTDGTYLEDQDMWFLSGIYREVYAFAEPKATVRDIKVTTELVNNYLDAKMNIEMLICSYGSDKKVKTEISLLKDNGEIFSIEKDIELDECEKTVSLNDIFVEKPLLWSSEKPNLYNLLITVKSGRKTTYKAIRIGFKQYEISGDKILVNGQPLLIKGVNRHDFDADGGWAVPDERYIQDFTIMKKCNINAIRTSHYPNDPRFYDYCDEFGFYVMDECDLETHGVRRKNVPGDNPMWTKAVIDRMERMVLRDRNHACVFMWSLGNEAGDGSNFLEMKKATLKLDKTRNFHYEGDFDFTKSDVISRMYPVADMVEKLGNKEPISISWFDNIANSLAADNKPIKKEDYTKPVIFCEYAHSMENSLGNFQEYMDAFEKYDNLCGGFIWDFVDQAIHKIDENGKDMWLYGSDFSEKKHWFLPPYNTCAIAGSNTYFNANGIIGADRLPHPASYEVKKVYSPIKIVLIDAEKGEFSVKNKQLFSDLSDFEIVCIITLDGEVISKKKIERRKYASIKPLSEKTITVELPYDKSAKGEVIVTFSIQQKEAKFYCEKGFEQSFDQYILKQAEEKKSDYESGETLRFEQVGKTVRVMGKNFIYKFYDGMLVSALKGEKEYIKEGIKPNYYRPLTDNDIDFLNFAPPFIFANPLYAWKLATNKQKITKTKVMPGMNALRLESDVSVLGLCGTKVIFTIKADGEIEVRHEGKAKSDMLSFGLSVQLEKEFDKVKWYGRGPFENYCDRKTGSKIGKYEMTVGELEHKYMRPQENGHRCDVRNLEISNENGQKVIFRQKGKEPFGFNIWHYTPEDLDKATHIHTQESKNLTFVNIDLMQRGVGGDMPGSACLREPYIMHKGRKYVQEFTLSFE